MLTLSIKRLCLEGKDFGETNMCNYYFALRKSQTTRKQTKIVAMPETSVKLHTLSSVIKATSHQRLVMSRPRHQSLKPFANFATGHAKTHRSIFMVKMVKEIAM